jgi:hypothetical protein
MQDRINHVDETSCTARPEAERDWLEAALHGAVGLYPMMRQALR